MRVWSGPLVGVAQEESNKISLPFLTFLQVSTNFRSFHRFLGIKQMEKHLKPRAQYWAGNWPVAYSSTGPAAGGPGPQANGPGSPTTGRVGVPARAQARGHRGHGRRSGVTGTGSQLGEV
jgi:hypothetical protein